MRQTEGIIYPLTFLATVKNISHLTELKVITVIYGYDAIAGIEASPLTFTDVQNLTGLSKRGTQMGLDRAISDKLIRVFETQGNRFYLPNAQSSPHDHDHGSFTYNMVFKNNDGNNHDHAAQSIRQQIYGTLCNEFGMIVSPRVAADIALSPKYEVERLYRQIRFTRWETNRGIGGQPVNNPAGRFVYRVKSNKPAPKGFDLETALIEDEGWKQTDIYKAIFLGEISLPDIEDSMAYHSWLQHDLGMGVSYD